jgi:hypothetical protein
LDLQDKICVMAALIVLAAMAPAAARESPAPPPSGIVVHLFGPDSVMSNVMPVGQSGAARGAPAAPGAAAAPATAAGYEAPSLGDVLHQMFVTGDPNDPPRPSTGKTGHQLAD